MVSGTVSFSGQINGRHKFIQISAGVDVGLLDVVSIV
jgi:hypothetical protein